MVRQYDIKQSEWWEVNQSGQLLQCYQHRFCAFCVIANSWQPNSTSIFCTNDVLCILMSSVIPSLSMLTIEDVRG